MHNPTSLRFAEAARALGQEARRLGLVVPGFRSPPRLAGVERSIRRHRSGHVSVAVVVRGRPWPAVLADLVEGVLAANGLQGAAAAQVRALLWAAVHEQSVLAA
jgi:transglutaminase-like putative cysteine protease